MGGKAVTLRDVCQEALHIILPWACKWAFEYLFRILPLLPSGKLCALNIQSNSIHSFEIKTETVKKKHEDGRKEDLQAVRDLTFQLHGIIFSKSPQKI